MPFAWAPLCNKDAPVTEPDHIPVWRRIDWRTTTSGQPSEDDLAAIAALGVRRVINLALHSHEKALSDETATVAALGMDYVHIPVPFDAPDETHFARFCEAMAAVGDAPVHVHCIINARVSAFFYRYQREVMGLSEAQSRAAMDSIWRPGGVWAAFIGDDASVALPHGGPVD